MTKRGNHGDAVLNISDHKRKRAADLEDDVDALFQLPLAEFTGARNTLAAQLKKSGRGDESARVKALAKPTVSAWAVNQLYWDHRDQFDQLTALGQRFHKAQKSGKVAEMRTALESRREAISNLSDLATELLRDAGHNPAPDTIHRITTTLEGLSAYASLTDGLQPGRLTNDVDPPGFESLAGFSSGAGLGQLLAKPTRSKSSQKTDNAVTNTQRKIKPRDDTHQLEDIRKAKITAARVSLQQAKKSLTAARARAQSLEAAQKKADAEAKKAEKQRRDIEASLEKAKAASADAAQRARSVAVEVADAVSAVEDAEETVEAASQELESLFRDTSL